MIMKTILRLFAPNWLRLSFIENSPPDTSGINKAAESNAEIGKDALAFYKQAYADQAPLRQQAADTAQRVSDAQIGLMDTQTRLANEADAYTKSTFRPLEQSIVRDAQTFDTEGERQRLAGLALGDVNQQFDTMRGQMGRNLTRSGVNPSDGASIGAVRQLALAQALTGADAQTKARSNAMTLGRAMKMDAASLGRNLPSQQATNTQLALSAGNSANASGQTPLAVAQQGTTLAGQGFNTAISANNSSGNLYGTAANLERGEGAGSMLGGLANLGMAAKYMYPSDKTMKTDRAPVDGGAALSAVRKMPVDSWKYKHGSEPDDGGQTHIGPMAQDAKDAMGEAAAPGGKQIDAISLVGTTLAAVQELDKKVMALAQVNKPERKERLRSLA